MPIYEYKCSHCGHIWEESLKISERNDPKSKPCSFCLFEGEVALQLGATAFADPLMVGKRRRKDECFEEKMKRVKKAYPTLRSANPWDSSD